MISLALYFLACLGVAFAAGFSKLSLPFRVLLGGKEEQHFAVGVVGSDVVSQQTIPAVKPLIPWLGPWIVALLECPGCLGFHLGWAAWIFRAELYLPVGGSLIACALLAFATASSNMLGAKYIGLLE